MKAAGRDAQHQAPMDRQHEKTPGMGQPCPYSSRL